MLNTETAAISVTLAGTNLLLTIIIHLNYYKINLWLYNIVFVHVSVRTSKPLKFYYRGEFRRGGPQQINRLAPPGCSMLVLLLKNWKGLSEMLEDFEFSTLEHAEDNVVVVMKYWKS